MIGVVIDLILFVGAIVLIVKHKKPNPGALLVVQPGRKFNRLQSSRLTRCFRGIHACWSGVFPDWLEPSTQSRKSFTRLTNRLLRSSAA